MKKLIWKKRKTFLFPFEVFCKAQNTCLEILKCPDVVLQPLFFLVQR